MEHLEMATAPKNDVAVKDSKSTEVVKAAEEFDYSAYEGAGMEGATKDAYAIPFLTILQKTSPQVDEDQSTYVKGAKAGMIFETVSGKLYDGKTGVLILPAAYQMTYLRWGPRTGEGQGFKGRLSIESVARMRAEKRIVDVDGKILVMPEDGSPFNPARADRLAESHYRYCLLLDEETGSVTRVLLSIVSTQIKKSRTLATRLDGIRVNGKEGKIKPPTWANRVRLTTVPESNDKGSWYGMKFDLEGLLGPNDPLFKEAAAFNESVIAGSVVVSEEAHDGGNDGGSGGF